MVAAETGTARRPCSAGRVTEGTPSVEADELAAAHGASRSSRRSWP